MPTSQQIHEGDVFGVTLRRLRERGGFSQQSLSSAAGLTTNFLSDLERGVKVASLTTIIKLAYALNCPPADLLVDFTPALVTRIARGR